MIKIISLITKISNNFKRLTETGDNEEVIKTLLNELTVELTKNQSSVSLITSKIELPTIEKSEHLVSNYKLGDLYINDGLRLLKIVEIDKKGIAFQESLGYVIYVTEENLHLLKKCEKITDSAGLEWSIEPLDLEGAKATNAVGDEVLGLKHIQILIDGSEPLNVK